MEEEIDNPEEIDKEFQLVVSKQAKKKSRSVQKPKKVGTNTKARLVSFNIVQ